MRRLILTAISGLLMLSMTSGILAQGRITIYQPRGNRIQGIEPIRRNASGATRIVGSVIDIGQKVVANAKVQLRNINTGEVEQEQTSSDSGEYAFDLDDAGSYVVEMVMVDGYIVALSNAGTISRFETMQTVIQLPGRWNAPTQEVIAQQGVSSFVGMSAQATMTAATIAIAVDANIRPADSGEPVSP